MRELSKAVLLVAFGYGVGPALLSAATAGEQHEQGCSTGRDAPRAGGDRGTSRAQGLNRLAKLGWW